MLKLVTRDVPDVVFASSEVARPVSRFPEAIPVHLPAALAERRVTVRSSLQVEVTQLFQVCAHNLKESLIFQESKVTSHNAESQQEPTFMHLMPWLSLGTQIHVELCASKLFY